MSSLPAVPSSRRPRPVLDTFVFGGIERLTEHLMRGNEIPEADWADLRMLCQRFKALENALDARERAAGAVLEDDE